MSGLGIGLGQVVVKFGAFGGAAFLQQSAVLVVMLEDFGVNLKSRLVALRGLGVFFTREYALNPSCCGWTPPGE